MAFVNFILYQSLNHIRHPSAREHEIARSDWNL